MLYTGTFIMVLSSILISLSEADIKVVAKETGPTGLTVEVSWSFPQAYNTVSINWESVHYLSEVTSKQLGRTIANQSTSSATISDYLRLDQQYKFCVMASKVNCPVQEVSCAYVKVSRYNKTQLGPHLYMVFGPVHSTNVSVTWAPVPKGVYVQESHRTDIGYKLEWRKIDGRIGGHPGHSSHVVSHTQLIKGLQPATRYEICAGETLNGKEGASCDTIVTEEDVPGPPEADTSSCYVQAHGTHWRCDVTWLAPKKTNGKIQGYQVAWRDQEGFDLQESSPKGTLCDPFCFDTQILKFHPSEACIKARTEKGRGWESCVKVTDISSRILSFFEAKVLLIILTSIIVFHIGPRILKGILRCCVRILYQSMEQERKYPV